MLIDTHAHLDFPDFEADLGEVLARAREAGVERIVTVGTDAASSRRAMEMSERHPEVFFSPGIHPHEADRSRSTEEIRGPAAHPRAVAVGETGLDYVKRFASIPHQKELFLRPLELARETGKPVVIHCREAHGDVIAILRPHAPLRGVIHCFSGGPGEAETYLSLGFHISLAGPVTYPKSENLREVARHVPLDRLLVETDAPFLAPQERRGKRNEPAWVRFTAEKIAALRGLTPEEFAEATSRNAKELFGLP